MIGNPHGIQKWKKSNQQEISIFIIVRQGITLDFIYSTRQNKTATFLLVSIPFGWHSIQFPSAIQLRNTATFTQGTPTCN